MDKLLEIVLAAVVISVTGLAVLFVVNGQTGSFTDFMDSQSQGAQCDLLKDKYDRAAENENQEKYSQIATKAGNQGCSWADNPNPGPQCGTITNQANCEASGVCVWGGGSCNPK